MRSMPLPDVTRAQALELEQETLRRAALEADAERSGMLQSLAAACAQLARVLEAQPPLRGTAIWRTAEAHLAKGRGAQALLLVVVPRQGAAGAGIAMFPVLEVANMRLPETRRAYFADIAAGAFQVALEQAVAGPADPNGGG